MYFKMGDIEVPINIYNEYIDNTIDRIFKILPIYENCLLMEKSDFSTYLSYLDKLILQINGSKILLSDSAFITLSATLIGLINEEKTTQKKVKSTVFHCIDIISKLKKKGV